MFYCGGRREMMPALVVPRKNPPPLVWLCSPAPNPAVTALPLPLPKLKVSSPVLDAIEPVNKFVVDVPSLTRVLVLLTDTLVKRRKKLALEMTNCPAAKAMAGVPAGGLVQGAPCTASSLVNPLV